MGRAQFMVQHVLLFELTIIVNCKFLFEFTIIVNLEYCFPGHGRKEKKIILLGPDFSSEITDYRQFLIAQFRYIKIQPKTVDLSARLVGITTEFVGFIPTSLVLRSIVLG